MYALSVTLRSDLGSDRSSELLGVVHSSTTKKRSEIPVVQTADAIEVSNVRDGTSNTIRFPLDDGEGTYHTDSHILGKCKGQLKGKRLVLDWVVVTRPVAGGPEVQLHTRERWELSRDSKTLIIHVDVDNPQLPMANIGDPWTEIYTRD